MFILSFCWYKYKKIFSILNYILRKRLKKIKKIPDQADAITGKKQKKELL